MSSMTPVKTQHVTGKQTAHQTRNAGWTGAKQKLKQTGRIDSC